MIVQSAGRPIVKSAISEVEIFSLSISFSDMVPEIDIVIVFPLPPISYFFVEKPVFMI